MIPRLALVATAVAWLYEAHAITSRRRPTITVIVHRHRHRRTVALAVGAGIGWLAHHLLVQEG